MRESAAATGLLRKGSALLLLLIMLVPGCSAPVHHREGSPPDAERIRRTVQLTDSERAWLEQGRTIRVRVGEWPPYMMALGVPPSGIALDFLALAAEVHSLTFEFIDEEAISWKDTLTSLQQRTRVDMVPVIQQTPERRSFLVFTKPFQVLPWVIITKNDADYVSSLEDLEGKSVAIFKDFFLQKVLERQYPNMILNVIDSSTPTLDILKSVATGQSFATVNALPVMAYFMNQYALTNLKVAAPAQLPDMELSMGIRKDWGELASILDKTFAAMTHAERSAIRDRWMTHQDLGIPKATVTRWAAMLGVVILASILGFLFINRTLKRQVATRTAELAFELVERHKAEEALRESVEHIRQLALNSPLPMVITDLSGRFLFVNDRFRQTLGWTAEDIGNIDNWGLLAYPDEHYRARVMEEWKKIRERGNTTPDQATQQEASVTCADGSVKDIQFHFMAAGERTVTTLVDVTERKLADAERERLIEELELNNEELERFVYTVSHDLKSPIITISGFAGKLEAEIGTTLPERIRPDLGHISRACTHMTDLLDDLLKLSRVGRIEDNVEEVDLCSLVREVCEVVQGRLGDSALLQQDGLPTIRAERARMFEVFQNLVENALKYGSGNQAPCVTIGHEQREGQTVLFVEDNGEGIAERYREKVFGLFEQLNPDGTGTGVGLALVRRIVEHHGGHIWIEDGADGSGTRFCFTLGEPEPVRDESS